MTFPAIAGAAFFDDQQARQKESNDISLRSAALGLQGQQLELQRQELEQKRLDREDVRKQTQIVSLKQDAKSLLDAVAKVQGDVKGDVGRLESITNQLFMPEAATLERRLAELGQPFDIRGRITAILKGTLTPQAAAKLEAEGKVAGAAAVTGQPLTQQQLAKLAGVAPPEPPSVVQLQVALKAAEARGDSKAAQEIQAAIDAIGRGQYAPEQPTKESLNALQKTIRNSNDILGQINVVQRLTAGNPSVASGLGAVQGFINETVAQVVPGLFSGDRARYEAAVGTLRESALRLVNQDSRFSDADRKVITNLFPSTGVFANPDSAAVRMEVLQAFFTRRVAAAYDEAGIPGKPPIGITPEVIRKAVWTGLLDRKEAVSILETLFPGGPPK